MKTNDTSTRELAMEWWGTFSEWKKASLIVKYLPIPKRPQVLSLDMITGREIEEIWAKESSAEWWESLTYKQKDQYRGFLGKYTSMDSPVDPVQFANESIIEEIWLSEVINKQQPESIEKPNRKQFKEFSPELFKAYIDKFSDEDKIKAMKMLYDEHQEFKKFDKVKVTKVGNNASDFHSNGLGIYKIADWKTTIFEIAGEYCPITFSHTPKCYGAYPLRLVGTSAILGYVYNIAIQKI